ncbi:MAG: hypothetical protein VB078_01320 [Clostridiaceae bacterium]|nr:hypothetical protein [Clostridiaceae bacterium]
MKLTRKLSAVFTAIVAGAGMGAYRALGMTPAMPTPTFYWLIALFTLLFAVFAIMQGSRPAPVSHKKTDIFKAAIAISCLLAFVSAGYELYILFKGTIDILTACVIALLIVSAYSIIKTIISEDQEVKGVMFVIPVFFMSLFLLQTYKQHAASCPNVHLFAIEILAISLLTLAVYSVSTMIFLDRSRSFLITFSIPCSIMFSSIIIVSSILTNGNYGYIFDFPQILIMAAFSIYCGAWYLNPPVKYERHATKEAPAKTEPLLFDQEKDTPIMPDVDSIIEEIKEMTEGDDANDDETITHQQEKDPTDPQEKK